MQAKSHARLPASGVSALRIVLEVILQPFLGVFLQPWPTEISDKDRVSYPSWVPRSCGLRRSTQCCKVPHNVPSPCSENVPRWPSRAVKAVSRSLLQAEQSLGSLLQSGTMALTRLLVFWLPHSF